MPVFPVGTPVRLVACYGEPIPFDEQLRAVVSGNSSVCDEYEVTFAVVDPAGDVDGGFDFWPFDECALDLDPSPAPPMAV